MDNLFQIAVGRAGPARGIDCGYGKSIEQAEIPPASQNISYFASANSRSGVFRRSNSTRPAMSVASPVTAFQSSGRG